MKKAFYKAILFLFLIITFFSLLGYFSQTYAQGTYDCKWIDAGGVFVCRSANISCDSGYIPDNAYCFSKKSKSICNASTHNYCILQTTSTPVPPTGAVNQWCDPGTEKFLNTAIGCIPILTDENTLMGWILQWAIGIGGGVAFLLIVYAGFMIMTSQGNPDRLQAGKELLTSALAGIILLIFSIFLLKLIGVDILKLPGFGV